MFKLPNRAGLLSSYAPFGIAILAAIAAQGVSASQAQAASAASAALQPGAATPFSKSALGAMATNGVWVVDKNALRISDRGDMPAFTLKNPESLATEVPRLGDVSRDSDGGFLIQSSKSDALRGVIRIHRLGPNAPFADGNLGDTPGDDR